MSPRGRIGPGGILLLDKPVGPTSHDIVARVRRITGYRKVGHGGTLDPFASGLLVLGLNAATRLLGHLGAGEKCYRARIHFGIATDSEDATGEIVRRGECRLDRGRIEAVLPRFRGEIEQVPPALSALKVNGERAYALVRDRNQRPELPARKVSIHELQLLRFEAPFLELRVRCGGGTYLRALARDLGEALDCPAHLAELRRESVGALRVEDAVSIEELQAGWEGDRGPGWLPPLAAVEDWPRRVLGPEQVTAVKHGTQPRAEWFAGEESEALPRRLALVDEGSKLVALAERDRERGLRLIMVLGEEPDAGLPD